MKNAKQTNSLIELPVQLYRLFTTEPTAPRIYAIGARGYLVDYDEFKAWKPPPKVTKKKTRL